MKVALIIDNEAVRNSLRTYLLEEKHLFRKVYAFNSVDTFISDAYMLTDVDIVVFDMHLSRGIPSLEGIHIMLNTPFLEKARLLMLTCVTDHNYTIFKWLCTFPSSYIDREMSSYAIREAIITVAMNGTLLEPVVTKKDESEYAGMALTAREEQVVAYVIARENEARIAKKLGLNERLVRRYIRHALYKIRMNTAIILPVTDRPGAIPEYKSVG
jgi:DNA-binding NarL/FixJ family response regulator